jgi:hypothetical protein
VKILLLLQNKLDFLCKKGAVKLTAANEKRLIFFSLLYFYATSSSA